MIDITIGIPKIFMYSDEGRFIKYFLDDLGFKVVVSSDTNNTIIDSGEKYSNILSIKSYIGHFLDLKDKCDYIICIDSDYSSFINDLYLSNVINLKMENFDYKYIYRSFINLILDNDIPKKKVKNAYLYARIRVSKDHKNDIILNTNKLFVPSKKILLVGNSYTLYDDYLMRNIVNYFEDRDYTIIYYDKFDKDRLREESIGISKEEYLSFGKNMIGSLNITKDYISGVVLISDSHFKDDTVISYIEKNYFTKLVRVDMDELSTGKVCINDIFAQF